MECAWWRFRVDKNDRYKNGPRESEGRDALSFWLVMNTHGLSPNPADCCKNRLELFRAGFPEGVFRACLF